MVFPTKRLPSMTRQRAVEILQRGSRQQQSQRFARTVGWMTMSGLMMVGFAGGCRDERATPNAIINPGFEESFSDVDVPEGWSLEVDSGTYELGQIGGAHGGAKALAMAGTGGSAMLRSSSFTVPGDSLICVEGWFQRTKQPEIRVAMEFATDKTDGPDRPKGADGRKGSAEASPTPTDFRPQADHQWRRLQVFARSPGKKTQTIPTRLVVGCVGDGLIRVDDVRGYAAGEILQEYLLADSGFENATQPYQGDVWNFVQQATDPRATKSSNRALAGGKSLNITGREGWAMLTTDRQVPTRYTVHVQGFVRAERGTGYLKLDYYNKGEKVGDSRSAEVTAGRWTRVMLSVDAAVRNKSDAVRVSIVAENPDGAFDVSFDNVEVFACR